MDDLDPLQASLEDLGVVNEVEIAMPQAKLGVLHAAPFIGVGKQGLTENLNRIGENRQFTGLGHTEVAVHAQKVAKVQLLGQGPACFAYLLLAHIDLNAARPIFEVEELNFAHAASLHDPAGGAHPLWRRGTRWERTNL